MPYTSTDLDAIRSAITKGERTVQFADRSVTYRSADELIALEAHVARQIAIATRRRPRQTFGVGSKGF